ncbi:hypothetical protein PG997_007752 [Apiospora hydei]|uniref:SH3 domain-containing protein n=1 Tax=Apiospora hydei TaxID=1337664 RepID=A0ABR1W8W6_9PEZI
MASAPFKVKALYEYSSGHEDDLPFEIGQVITITEDDDPDWYGGEYLDASGVKQEGIFPRNFVEKYEPTAPPRPTRPRKKDQPEHTARPDAAPEPTPESVVEPEESGEPYEPAEEEPTVASPPRVAEPLSPRSPAPAPPKPVEPAPVAAPAAPAPSKPEPSVAQSSPKAPAQARAPPPVSEKPASFRDRIAAFNKPAAPPVAPFKPSGLSSGSSGFIKKPFVAPPPSRNAYVPPPKETPTTKVYRREEDPEIREKEAENLETAQHAGLVPTSSHSQEGQDEDQPKPTTLKERIALLQKQQAEAAQRHSEAASKKEKPKRPPPKKRTESDGPQEGTAATPGVGETPMPLERRDTESVDEPPPPKQQLPTRRKLSKDSPEDGNEADMSGAGDATEGQEDDLTEREDSDAHPKPSISRAATGATEKAADEEAVPQEEGEEKAEAEDDEDDDPEARRKEELRARMAKMSGGMGMMGMHSMFGPPMPSPVGKKKKAAPMERRSSEQPDEGASTGSPIASAPPVPAMMALPGMGQQKPANEETSEHDESEIPDDEDITPVTSTSPRASESARRSMSGPPPLPGGRPAPPPVPAESRPPPPPPPAGVTSPSVGSESDDELSENPMRSSVEFSRPDYAPSGRAPPPPIPLGSPKLPPAPSAPTSAKRASYMSDDAAPSSPPIPTHPSKRTSMPPPPPPGAAPIPPPPTQSRPPPPPPPGVPSRPSTSDEPVASPMKPGHLDNSEEGEVTEYDGDYDTDIASSVPHKEALKSHARDSSLEDNTPVRSPISEGPPPSLPPPVPSAAAPRAIPPPIPSQPPPSQPPARTSIDAPRGAPPPPPPPPTKSVSYAQDDEYDPYNYSAPKSSVPAATSYSMARTDDTEPDVERSPPSERREPPPAPPANRAPPRQSIDAQRAASGRRSTDATRPSMSMESGYVAEDVDLAEHTNWWLQPNSVPPALQGRKDIFFESDESTSSTQSGMTEVTKEVYVLFQDYSQTIITARFDPQNPADTQLDQRHEPPPRSLRQDQLEQAYERYGLQIANAVPSKKDTVIGDGSPHGLLYELLKPFKDALQPVGTRAYGALVYANIANASTQMHDEIRPGDIISIRNAKFQGKHGPMHAKYSMEVGKPDHVAIVAEWDGVKKSGEVKIWRIMPRSWVGWDSQH